MIVVQGLPVNDADHSWLDFLYAVKWFYDLRTETPSYISYDGIDGVFPCKYWDDVLVIHMSILCSVADAMSSGNWFILFKVLIYLWIILYISVIQRICMLYITHMTSIMYM